MPEVNLNIWARSVEVSPNSANDFVVELSGVDIADLVAAVGEAKLLDEIGEDACIEHFGIELSEGVTE